MDSRFETPRHRLALALSLATAVALAAGCVEPEYRPARTSPGSCIRVERAGIDLNLFGNRCDREAAETRPFALGSEALFSVVDDQRPDVVFEASDPTMLRVVTGRGGMANVKFLRAGRSTLSAYRNGGLLAERSLEARPISDVRWIVGASALGDPLEDAPQIALGTTLPMQAHYFAADQELAGAHALRVLDGPANTTYGIESQTDWLRVTPRVEGALAVRVELGGERVESIDFVALRDPEIDRIELVQASRSRLAYGHHSAVFARAYLADGTRIFGAPVRWSLGDMRQEETGEIFGYSINSDAPAQRLEAQVGSLITDIDIHPQDAGDRWVATDEDFICSAGGRPVAGFMGMTWIALALVIMRRRTRRP